METTFFSDMKQAVNELDEMFGYGDLVQHTTKKSPEMAEKLVNLREAVLEIYISIGDPAEIKTTEDFKLTAIAVHKMYSRGMGLLMMDIITQGK